MTVAQALAHAADLSQWIDNAVDKLEISSSDRERLAGALFDQVHEHNRAAQLLLKNSLTGTAFSLHRSTFETLIRGEWLLRCASEPEIAHFKNGRIAKGFGSLIKEIEARPGFDNGVFSKVKKEGWDAMCSYTHGGIMQAVRRITPESIEPDYHTGEVLEVIRSSSAFALIAAHEIFAMASRKDLLKEATKRMRFPSL